MIQAEQAKSSNLYSYNSRILLENYVLQSYLLEVRWKRFMQECGYFE